MRTVGRIETSLIRAVLLVLSVLVTFVSTAESEAKGNSQTRRWGLGWDDGIAIRYHVSHAWGLGLRLGSNLWYSRSLSGKWQHNNWVQIDGMVFHESFVGRQIVIGPFGELQWSLGRAGFSGGFERFGVAVGLRPVVLLGKRFRMEGEFGLELSYLDEYDLLVTYRHEDGHTEYYRYLDRKWDLKSIDDDLGFLSRLTFILML